MPRLLHASGRFDESPNWLRRDLKRWRELAGIITLTEVARPDRKAALEHPGWSVLAKKGEGRGECAILVRDLKWRVISWEVEALTSGRGLGRLSVPLHVTTAVLQRKGTGRLLIVSTAHMPAHVETLLRLGRRVPPASTWDRTARRWGKHVAAIRAAFPDAEVWVAADWNVNLAKPWARSLIKSAFKPAGDDLHLVWTDDETLEGTGRSIDGALTTLARDTARTHKAEASDHLAASFIARWPLRKKQP